MAYLVVFGSIIGYGSYIYALDKLSPAIVSMYAYINPVVAVFLGWLVLDERFDFLMILATIVILSGVVLVKTAQPPLARSKVRIKNQMKEKSNVSDSSVTACLD